MEHLTTEQSELEGTDNSGHDFLLARSIRCYISHYIYCLLQTFNATCKYHWVRCCCCCCCCCFCFCCFCCFYCRI